MPGLSLGPHNADITPENEALMIFFSVYFAIYKRK
jgi:hypothetical protein